MSTTASDPSAGKPEKVYCGTGWENKGGIAISVKVDKLINLPRNAYGEVKLFVGRRKSVDERSNSTHWVAVAEERPSTGYVPARPPEGMPSDPPGHTADKDLPF